MRSSRHLPVTSVLSRPPGCLTNTPGTSYPGRAFLCTCGFLCREHSSLAALEQLASSLLPGSFSRKCLLPSTALGTVPAVPTYVKSLCPTVRSRCSSLRLSTFLHLLGPSQMHRVFPRPQHADRNAFHSLHVSVRSGHPGQQEEAE